ncbi:Crocetin glucosyltransferase, chloroplastic [Dichanthelium oligosanthes]|uniref:Crocetin glucosyltransferase, chloroplastic n=1 Tax=Dichanthelium oligosanthes TaxID=888268 RepID=A0A1E5UVU5_9POAL|nr:Crocetin glucosyltransferase, chloroplastic [Dichanthelium oligosanthes]
MSPRPHFLVLTFPLQGHIAPALRLARSLLAAAPDALVTFSTAEAAHRRMFPAKPPGADGDEDGRRLEFLPFSDGTEAGYVRSSDPGAFNAYMASFHAAGARTIAEIMDALAARGRPVSRVVYTLLLPWAADVARERGVPSALYWIQPVAVFAIYYHYFHGHAGVVEEHRHDPSFVVELPGLAPQTIGDLPSFLTDSTDPSDIFHSLFTTFHDLMEMLDKESPKATVLVNTCQELELGSLAAVGAYDVLPVGPVLPSGDESSIFKQDDAEYIEWLDAKPANSVVYVAFGSLAAMAREQLDELLQGLEESGRPYLCIIRKDIKVAIAEAEAEAEAEMHGRLKNGMVVEWCDQMCIRDRLQGAQQLPNGSGGCGSEMSPPRPHFLVLAFPIQGHIAPALRLARRLLAVAPEVLATFSTTEAAHSRMFPVKSTEQGGEDGSGGIEEDGRLEFLSFSEGADAWDSRSSDVGAFNAYMASFHAAGARSVGELKDALAARGRPVSRVVYTLLLPWAADVARERGVPSALYWIQPAAVLATYYHYFHGHAGVVAEHRHDPSFVVELPGLAPQTIGDLPSYLTDCTDPSDNFHSIFTTIRDVIESRDKEIPRATVLANTCQELEVGAFAAVGAHDVLPVGPVLPSGYDAGIFEHDDAKYMEWLDANPPNSVVYVSFGSLAPMAREQLDELLHGLEESERPYLFVVRKDIKAKLGEAEAEIGERLKNGVVVEWCDQVQVLSHAAVGCFVTHCGWNSVLESVAAGVPMVCVPWMADQRMNAQLVVLEWRTGVRAPVDNGGVLRAAKVKQCIDEVMGNSDAAVEVRRMARKWKQVVTEASGNGGSSDRNLTAFVDGTMSEI